MPNLSTQLFLFKNGKIKAKFNYFDGQLEHTGKILLKNYNSLELAKALVDIGDTFAILKSVEETKQCGNLFQPKAPEHEYDSFEDFVENYHFGNIKYVYLYDEDKQKWFVSSNENLFDLKPLESELNQTN